MVPVMGMYVNVLLFTGFMMVGGEVHVNALTEQHAEEESCHQQNREQSGKDMESENIHAGTCQNR